jgi:hypothetical protein
MLALLAFVLFFTALAIRVGLIFVSALIVLTNVSDILSNGWSFWAVFWILLALALALSPVKFEASK